MKSVEELRQELDAIRGMLTEQICTVLDGLLDHVDRLNGRSDIMADEATLRDQFAAAALQGILANDVAYDIAGGANHNLAMAAYRWADAMMLARMPPGTYTYGTINREDYATAESPDWTKPHPFIFDKEYETYHVCKCGMSEQNKNVHPA